ncbi:hypothetical protein ANN_02233 [Periplaneta americana]|uniref:Uncharacterized protein n=1 Tax=Periplaneta americana TaxID=6978 RepID=A0ABQ8TWU0_PERAM|nr:hypothetical protein ANN_02233 [Periplaneta americana]
MRVLLYSQGHNGSPETTVVRADNFNKFLDLLATMFTRPSAPDYFLWGYLKGQVYVNKSYTLKQVKENIHAETRELESKTNVVNNNLKSPTLQGVK